MSKCNCAICGSGRTIAVLELAQIPVFCNVQYQNRDDAKSAARGDLSLQFCTHCHHLFNATFDARLLAYAPAYENALDFSPRFRQFALELADQLIATHGLKGKQVIDIGCGKGDFLRLLCERGGNTGTGFDPSYVPSGADAALPFEVITAYYGPEYAAQQADLISCRHVLEHIEQPVGFLSMIRGALAERPNTPVYFEVPNADYMLAEGAIWDLIYEHCGYFGSRSLRYAFAKAGFQVERLEPAFGHQYLSIEARPAPNVTPLPQNTEEGIPRMVGAFSRLMTAKLKAWRKRLEALRAQGQKAVIWGGGSKGVTLGNLLALEVWIPYVVDVNPRKQGRFVAGTGQHIVPPAFLATYKPDVVIIMNPLYTAEIQTEVEAMGLSPAFWQG